MVELRINLLIFLTFIMLIIFSDSFYINNYLKSRNMVKKLHMCDKRTSSIKNNSLGGRSVMKKVRWSDERKEEYKSNKKLRSNVSKHDKLRGNGKQPRSADSWDILLEKFDNTKNKKDSIGKLQIVKEDSLTDDLNCEHYDVCSGCSRKSNFDSTISVTRAKRFFQSENIEIQTHLGPIHGWRTHVKLAVRPLSRWGGLKFGLYKENSHELEPIPNCKVHHPRINEAVEVLRVAATDAGVSGYEHANKGRRSQGDLRYIQMSLERHTNKIQVVLVWNAEEYKDSEQSLPRLMKLLKKRPDLFHSVTLNFNPTKANNIFNYQPKSWKLLWGPPLLKEKVGYASFLFRPQIFRQANLDAFEKGIIPLVGKSVPEGAKIAELYSGLGILGLNAAVYAQASEVLCSDTNEYVDEVFDRAADSLPKEYREKVFFENAPADIAVELGQLEDAECLIVDPPRKGLDPVVIDALLDRDQTPVLSRIIYISCGYDALERDARLLLDSGHWQVVSADGFLLFPGSDHLETVAVFERTKQKKKLSRDREER